MKPTIHPTYQTDVKVICSCGSSFITGSIKGPIHVEVCNKCHPFYTGEQRFVDAKGRVENFQKKIQAAEQMKTVIKARKEKKISKQDPKTKSLKELLGAV